MSTALASTEYLAGFVDGEGYLALGRRPRRGSYEYPLRVVVYNTNREILEGIRQTWGGTLSYSKRRNSLWKPQYALIWTNAAASRLLAKVSPYLRVKSRQAVALRAFHAHLRECQRTRDLRGRLLPLPQQEMESRESLYRYLKRLNARGRRASASVLRKNGSRQVLPEERVGPSDEYLAGFIDAEGSLMIAKCKGTGSLNPQYRARITLSNTCRTVLEDVQRAFGGILVDDPRSKSIWKRSYQLVWIGGMVEQLLLAVMSHLRVKREQAAVLMDFVRHQKSTRQGRQGRNGRFFATLSNEVIAYREGLYRRIRALNTRGLPILTAGARPVSPAMRKHRSLSGLQNP